MLLILTGTAPVHPPSFHVSNLTEWRRWAWNLLSVVEVLSGSVCVCVGGTACIYKPICPSKFNLLDASWYSRTGWAHLLSCLPAHTVPDCPPCRDFALRSLHAWAQVTLSVHWHPTLPAFLRAQTKCGYVCLSVCVTGNVVSRRNFSYFFSQMIMLSCLCALIRQCII